MSDKDKDRSGGVDIHGGDFSVGGDVVGRDKITTTYGSGDGELARQFAQIYQKIEERPPDPNVEKQEIKDKVDQIQKEAAKGDQANGKKVERWLGDLASMADDIFQVVAATLASPVAGVATVIRLVAQKAKEQRAQSK